MGYLVFAGCLALLYLAILSGVFGLAAWSNKHAHLWAAIYTAAAVAIVAAPVLVIALWKLVFGAHVWPAFVALVATAVAVQLWPWAATSVRRTRRAGVRQVGRNRNVHRAANDNVDRLTVMQRAAAGAEK